MSTAKPHIPLIYGTMGIGDEGTYGNRIHDKAAAQSIINTARENHVTELDTARAYCSGTTERWLQSLDTEGFTIDTKVYPVQPGDHAPAKLRATFQHSLETLGGKKVRVLYLHAPDHSTPFEETLAEVDKLYREGKFEIFGLSNFAAWQVASVAEITRAKGYVQPGIYQAMYNAIMRSIEDELIPACRKYGIRIVVYNPLAGGLFTGKVPSVEAEPTEKGTRFDSSSHQGQMYRARYLRQGFFTALNLLTKAVNEHNVTAKSEQDKLTTVEIALRWCQWHSALTPSDGVIIGASSAKQLERNIIDSAKGPLPASILEALDKGWLAAKATAPNYFR